MGERRFELQHGAMGDDYAAKRNVRSSLLDLEEVIVEVAETKVR